MNSRGTCSRVGVGALVLGLAGMMTAQALAQGRLRRNRTPPTGA